MRRDLRKRILSLLLAVLMLASLLPASAFAEEGLEEQIETGQSVEDPAVPEAPETTEVIESVPADRAEAPSPERGLLDAGETAPTVYTDLAYTDFPLPLAVEAGETRWFRFVAPFSCEYQFDWDYDNGLRVAFFDASMGRLEDDERTTWLTLTAGAVYYISAASGVNGAASGSIELDIKNDFSAFDDQTSVLNAAPGGSLRFAVGVVCEPAGTIGYAWYDPDGALLATTATGVHEIASAQRAGQYCCVVSDGLGHTRDVNFFVTIELDSSSLTPPDDCEELSFANTPRTVSVDVGETLWFRFTAPWTLVYSFLTDDDGVLLDVYDENMNQLNGSHGSYQKPDGTMGSAQQADLTEGQSYYLAVVSDREETVTAKLWIEGLNNFYAWASGGIWTEAAPGGQLTLGGIQVEGEPLGQVSYAWYDPDGVWLGTTVSDTLVIESVQRAGKYRCVVSDGLGHEDTIDFYVQIQNDVWISSQGQSEFFLENGQQQTLTAAVFGEGDRSGLRFQWYRDSISEEYAVAGATGPSYTLTFDGTAADYVCVMTDRYGNTSSAWFQIKFQNHFTVEPILQEGWTVDGAGGVHITLPVNNTGLTLQVRAQADDPAGIRYSWSSTKGSAPVIGVWDTDTLVLGPVTGSAYASVFVEDTYGGWKWVEFYIALDNEFSLIPQLQEGWTVDGNGDVHISLPAENEGVTLSAVVSAVDSSDLDISWQKCTQADIFETVEGVYGLTLETGVIETETVFELDVRDRFGNPAQLSFYITLGDGGVPAPPATFTEITVADFPVALNVGTDETKWFRFTAGGSAEHCIRTDCDQALELDLFDANMLQMNDTNAYFGAGVYGFEEPGAWLWAWLDEGESYYIAVREWQHGSPVAANLLLYVEPNFYPRVDYPARNADFGAPVTLEGIILDGMPFGALRYRWYAPDGTLLATTEDGSYTIESLTRGGNYTCVVSDSSGAEGEVTFYVRINNDVWIEQDGSNEFSLVPGQQIELKARVVGNGDRTGLALQWYKGYPCPENLIPGATGLSYTLRFDGEPATYYCELTDRFGNTQNAEFEVRYENHFSIEPVLQEGWEWNADFGQVRFALPVDNTGVTLQIVLHGDELSGATCGWYNNAGPNAAEVISESMETDTLILGKVSRFARFTAYAEDGHGNYATCTFSINLDNGLRVEPVLQTDWTVDEYGEVQITLPVNNSGVTLAANVQATDMTDLQVDWYRSTISGGFNEDLDEHGFSLVTGPISGDTQFYMDVVDRYGNPGGLSFRITVDNAIDVFPVTPDDGNEWYVYDGGSGNPYASHDIEVVLPSSNNGLTLQFEVSAVDKSRLVVTFYDGRNAETLTPDDETAEVWTYTHSISGPISEGREFNVSIFDGYDSYYPAHMLFYHVRVDNRFIVTSDKGSMRERIPVAYGKKAALKLNVSANDMSRLTIDWSSVDATEDFEWISPEVQQAIPDAHNMTSFTTPAIKKNTLFLALVDDGYGNTRQVCFYVCVENKLTLNPTVGVDVPRGAIPGRLIELDEGGSATLKVNARASKTTGLKINWYGEAPKNRWETGELFWPQSVQPLATSNGTSSSFQVSNLLRQRTVYAQAVDLYGNTAVVQFDVQVKNDLRAFAHGTQQESITVYAEIGKPCTLEADVFANDMTDLVIQWSAQREGMLEPHGSLVNGVSSYTIPSVDWTQFYTCNAIDRFGNRTPVSFHVIADNHLSIVPEGNRFTVALHEGEQARLVALIEDGDESALLGGENEMAIRVNADDKDGLLFQWMKAGPVGMMDASDGKVVISDPMSAESGAQLYNLQVTDRYNNHFGFQARVELDNELSAEMAGGEQITVNYGKKATLKLNVKGRDLKGLSYQWFGESGQPIPGATKASYTTPAIKQQERFSCRVTDRFGNQAWAGVTVQVQNKLSVTAVSPYAQFVQPGGSATMEVQVSAKNTQGLRFQWYRYADNNSQAIPGATGTQYTVVNVRETQEFFCEVTDLYGGTVDTWFVVGVDNGFEMVSSDGESEYSFFKGLSATLAVDVRLYDGTDYRGKWMIRHKDNDSLSWLPLSGDGLTEETVDGVWHGHDSYTRVWDEAGVYELLYQGVDRTGAIFDLFFTVTVVASKDYVADAPTLDMMPDGVSVSFEPVPADFSREYEIQRKTGGGKFVRVAALTLDTDIFLNEDGRLTWLDRNVKNNTKYSYRILLNGEDGWSKAGLASAVLTAYLPPVLKPVVVKTDGLYVSWQSVAGAAAYQLVRSVDGGDWTVVAAKVTKTNFLDTTAVSGAENSYRVCALNKKGEPISTLQNEGVGAFYLTAPVFTAELGLDGVELAWASVPGENVLYRIERKEGKGAFTAYANVNGLSFLDEAANLTNKLSYSYRVIAFRDEGESAIRTAKNLTYYNAPVLNSITATEDGVKLGWQKGTGASGYRVWRQQMGGEWEIAAAKVTKTTWTDVTLGYGRTAQYRVQSLKGGNIAVSEGSGLAAVNNNVFLPAPTLLSAAADVGCVNLQWSAADGAESYRVLRKTGRGSWTVLAELGAGDLSYRDTDVQNKTAYSYTVQALAENGQLESKYDTKGKSLTYYTTPVLVGVSAAVNGATIEWQAVPGVSRFRVMRWDETQGEWLVAVKSVSGTRWTDKKAQPGWIYTVQAVDGKGNPISGFDPIGVTFTA